MCWGSKIRQTRPILHYKILGYDEATGVSREEKPVHHEYIKYNQTSNL